MKKERIPQHIAIIMDGNGRWAKGRHLPRAAGHKQGAEALRATVKACREFGIKYLTVYVFSTENWSRPQREVQFLMHFVERLIRQEVEELDRNGVRMKFLGRIKELPVAVIQEITAAERRTADNKELQLNLMLNYGGRAELIDAVRTIVADVQSGKISNSQLNKMKEGDFNNYLYTGNIPDPDILIRTGGDYRISNYLLWQIAYSEIFVIDTCWPDFNRETLQEIITQFSRRDRRYGGLVNI